MIPPRTVENSVFKDDLPEAPEPGGAVDLPRLVRPYERVTFANGIEVTLEEDGRLRIMAVGRGLRAITIHPGSDNSCRIAPVGRFISEPNDQGRATTGAEEKP